MLSTITIYTLHFNGFNPLSIDYIDSHPLNTFVLCFFLWLNANIAKIGYEEIEHSYKEALTYSEKLKDINLRLDKEVQSRTKSLKKSWVERIKAMEGYSTIGKITSSLLHDIKTPLSSLGLSIDLLDEDDPRRSNKSSVEKLKSSYNSLLEMIHDTEVLMRNKEERTEISIRDITENAVNIAKSNADKHSIKISAKYEIEGLAYGVPVILLRIILNLLMNSIEELSTLEPRRPREIRIRLSEHRKHYLVSIRDTGKGIARENIKSIFDDGSSTKHSEHNYGLGLSFVRSSLSEYFDGTIEVRSEKGRYTEFKLRIPKNSHSQKK